MLSRAQIIFLQIARRQVLPEEADYRTALRNVCGVESCKDLSHRGFEDFLAFCESLGWRDTQHHETWWRDLVDNRDHFASRRQLHELAQLATQVTYPLPGLVRRMTSQRTDQPEKMTKREASDLIEAVKKMIERSDEATERRSDEGNRGMGILPMSDDVDLFPHPSAGGCLPRGTKPVHARQAEPLGGRPDSAAGRPSAPLMPDDDVPF